MVFYPRKTKEPVDPFHGRCAQAQNIRDMAALTYGPVSVFNNISRVLRQNVNGPTLALEYE